MHDALFQLLSCLKAQTASKCCTQPYVQYTPNYQKPVNIPLGNLCDRTRQEVAVLEEHPFESLQGMSF